MTAWKFLRSSPRSTTRNGSNPASRVSKGSSPSSSSSTAERRRHGRLARKFTARVYERAAAGPADQKNHAAKLASSPWVLCLDADERLSPELRAELLALRRGEPDCAGFSAPRRTNYLGRWIRHSGWAPEPRVRLFRKERARWEDDAIGGAPGRRRPRREAPRPRPSFSVRHDRRARGPGQQDLRPRRPAALRPEEEGPSGRPRRPPDAPVPENVRPQARFPRRLPRARHRRPRRLRGVPALGQAPFDMEKGRAH